MSPRTTLYKLLARLYRAAPDAATIATLRGVPGFDVHLPPPADKAVWLEEMAVVHHTLFGMTVYPYESLFRYDSLMINDGTEAITTFYAACGYTPNLSDEGSPDHLAIELDCMVRLDDYANQATAEGRASGAAWAEAQRQQFVATHLAVWVPPFADAVRRAAPASLYETVATVTRDLVLWELSNALTVPAADPFPVLFADADTETAQGEPTEEDEVGLNSIVRTMITPARVGLWLSRADMRGIARHLHLPLGMGDRHAQLRTLFEAAGQFDTLPALFDALDTRWRAAQAVITALYSDYPAWQPIGAAWQARLDAGQVLLTRLRQEMERETHA